MEYQVILSYLKQLQVSKFKECDYSLYLNYGTIGKLFYQDKVFIVILKKDSVCDYIFLEYYMKGVKNLEDILDSIRERIIAGRFIKTESELILQSIFPIFDESFLEQQINNSICVLEKMIHICKH